MTDRVGSWEIAARISSGGPRLVMVVVPDISAASHVARELRDDLESLSETEVVTVVAHGPSDVERAVVSETESIVHNLQAFTAEDWRVLDLARSRLRPRANIALVADEETAKRLGAFAPGLASWLAGSSYAGTADEKPGSAEREERLKGLRERYRMTDDEAVARAERHEPPTAEPEFAIWLVLLGRGDLVLRPKP